MKQIITLICLLISSLGYSQKSLETPYQHKMDSLSLSKLDITYNEYKKIINNIQLNRLKITYTTRVNTANFTALLSEADDVYDIFNDATTDDYLSIFKYDIRGKYYLNKKLRLISRVVIMGSKYTTNQYSCGIQIRF